MNLKNTIKKIWKDNVIGSVIACLVSSLIFFLCGLLTSIIPSVKCFFLRIIPVYLFVIIIFFFFVIILFISLFSRNKKSLSSKNQEIHILENEIEKLKTELSELKSEPENHRMNLFSNGDVVIIKGADAYFFVVEYTVVEKTRDEIIIVDNQGNKKTISPNALLTTKEYREEALKQKMEYEVRLKHNKRGHDPFSYI